MLAITEVLSNSLESISESFVSKAEVQKPSRSYSSRQPRLAMAELLEAGHVQFDRNFWQLKKIVYHVNSVLLMLLSTWTSKPPLAVRYKLDTNALEMESKEGKSHGSTLERHLAWEKKLYEEVKEFAVARAALGRRRRWSRSLHQ